METDNSRPTYVLFVCLGNICRSPLAEAALRDLAQREALDIVVDSAGTGDWHIGHAPDVRAQEVAQRLGGLSIANLQARQVSTGDFARFDHILAMDTANLRDLHAVQPAGSKAQLSLLLDHLQGYEGGSVADPYYGDTLDFELCWQQVVEATKGFARTLRPPKAA